MLAVTYVTSRLVKVRNILYPWEERGSGCHRAWSRSGRPAQPSPRGVHLPSGEVVFSEFPRPWSACLATAVPLFVLRRTLKARFIFLNDLLLTEDRSKGRAEEQREGTVATSHRNPLLCAHLVRDHTVKHAR